MTHPIIIKTNTFQEAIDSVNELLSRQKMFLTENFLNAIMSID